MTAPGQVSMTLTLVRDQGHALLMREGATGVEVSLPKSQIVTEASRAGHGSRMLVTMPRWLAVDRGLLASTDGAQGRLL